MRKLGPVVVIAASLVLTGACGTSTSAPAGPPEPVTLVEKEYEPAGFKAATKDKKGSCKTKDSKTGKCKTWNIIKGKPAAFEPECYEIEWSDGREDCTTPEEFERLQIGAVRP